MLEDIRKRANDRSIEYVSPEQYQDDVLTLFSLLDRYRQGLEYYANNEYLRSIGYSETAIFILEKE